MIIGFSIMRRGEGFEPVSVSEDLTTEFVYPDDGGKLVLSSADAIREGRSIARAHHLPFRSRLNAFKSLIEEAHINA